MMARFCRYVDKVLQFGQRMKMLSDTRQHPVARGYSCNSRHLAIRHPIASAANDLKHISTALLSRVAESLG